MVIAQNWSEELTQLKKSAGTPVGLVSIERIKMKFAIEKFLAVAAMAAALMFTAASASAFVAISTETYSWSGVCTDCGADPDAYATLVLSDSYTPGTAVAASDFMSFVYHSSLYDLTSSTLSSSPTPFFGTLPTASGMADLHLEFVVGTVDWLFQTFTTGNWELCNNVTVACQDIGTDSIFTRNAAPEPASLALLGLALAGLGFSRRRIS